eukprot:superscaffoldBa00014821_g26453
MDPAPVVRNQTAVNGSFVILPCSFPGEEIVGDAAYQNRVSLQDGLQDGDVSLLLKNVKYSDSGSYECQVFYRGVEGNEQKTVCVDNLTVKNS